MPCFDTPKPRRHNAGPIPSSAPTFNQSTRNKSRHRRASVPAPPETSTADEVILTRQYAALSPESQRAFWQCPTRAAKMFLLTVPHTIISL